MRAGNLRLAGIVRESLVDGPGMRFVIFTQGCPHHCVGCHNPATHDPSGGYSVDTESVFQQILQTRLIRGVTFSGGEPFLQAEALAPLAERIRSVGLNIVAYSGFLYEELREKARKQPAIGRLLNSVDLLVDGPYRHEERDLQLAFRGSRNQRLIDVQQSLAAGKVVLWSDMSGRLGA
ncbi:MAG TPA: anaerobic ribonucleoside-triphosphate reductase activating protein [Patescibacteria group bacterium]|nr:anaerobic ribonucleoside-triphosphate reductase activating protein [Patescibacteria group bacterium]